MSTMNLENGARTSPKAKMKNKCKTVADLVEQATSPGSIAEEIRIHNGAETGATNLQKIHATVV
jgi:hypothetical protein